MGTGYIIAIIVLLVLVVYEGETINKELKELINLLEKNK